MALTILIVVLAILALGYLRAPLIAWTVAALAGIAYSVFATGCPIGWLIGAGVVALILNLAPLRRALITGPIFSIFKKITPAMSQTEQEAINAGTVWWDAELFSGKPNFKTLHNYPAAKLTAEEQAFLDGPTEELCRMIDDWKIVHELKDLPPDVWQFIKDKGFLGMIIKKKYGGVEFSNTAHARVVTKIATRGGSAAVSVMVPNSLGPGELLQHYGTEAQKDYYLPRLAKGLEIPCFALTSPYAGSDAGAIPDFGVVCRGSYTDPRTGQRHENVIGIRLNWEKRWITLAPIATVLGLAFKLHDPEKLLGGKEDIGITCALIPAEHEGVQIGRRHCPPGSVFMNGPTMGKDVFIPMDWVIGGQDYVGQGWRMLVECLSVGRAISLPAMSVASGKFASFVTGAYARIREQFGLSIGKFEGVDEALARIGGYTYQMDSAQRLALAGLDSGEKPSVISAILKYHNTERMRKVLNDAMDVHGGKAVVLGPRNYLGNAYQTIPVGITVEGANILTRSMIIYGQGAIRCHPFVLREMKAAMANDGVEFDKAFSGHLGFVLDNAIRSFVLGITGSKIASAPVGGDIAQYYKDVERLSAAFALASDMAMFSMGGSLKFREKISARLGDVLSNLYIATAALKRFADDGSPKEDLPLLKWSVLQALHDAQEAMTGFLANLPNRPLAFVLNWIIFPLGRHFTTPRDRLGTKIARILMQPGAARDRLTRDCFVPQEETDAVGVLNHALNAHIEAESTEGKLRRAQRDGKLKALNAKGRLDEALQAGLITQAEFDAVTRARRLKREVIMVDDFDKMLDKHDTEISSREPV
ncbi:acyl-CoA dehydrogenase [Chitinimonas taiwanensis]|uniref:Acyl-coenzyme A dehydrogenase n=1 Tax=Chitinimonas taiwanensis DSM 18899 TaxID=1121279 RepID=A0A1K2HAL3_9NEIS|nr:acyl-CoA dehydrogenase [Chitinimonas taiwanensis]SFZ73787.1 acyl-CoA dehydrogenase [Chitinimonas taiwanensis DSM 18899]